MYDTKRSSTRKKEWFIVESKHKCQVNISFVCTHTLAHHNTHRTPQLDQAPIVDAENGIHDDSSLEKKKFEDKL